MAGTDSIQVLMVCLGNICRSPTAEGVFRHLVQQAGLQTRIVVDSAGTSDWHVGEPPDPRTVEAAARRGYDLSQLRARQVQDGDFMRFDHIIAMDGQNLRELQRRQPSGGKARLSLLLTHGTHAQLEVPDPYSGGSQHFEQVLDLCEAACQALLTHVQQHQLATRQAR